MSFGQIVRSTDAEPIDAVMAAEGRFSDMGIEAIRAVFCRVGLAWGQRPEMIPFGFDSFAQCRNRRIAVDECDNPFRIWPAADIRRALVFRDFDLLVQEFLDHGGFDEVGWR